MPERLRGSTRNRIRNACVGSNPAVCALLFFCSSRRGERMDGLRPMDDSVGRFDLWKRRQKKRKFSKKKRKKNIIATKIHHLLVRTSRKEVRERALSLLLSLSKESLGFFSSVSRRAETPRFSRVFFRARDHTHRTRERWVDYPRKKNKKTPSSHPKRVKKSSRRRGRARRVWPTRLERNARNECARTRFFYRSVSKRSRCMGGCRRPSKRRRRKKMMMMTVV